MRISAEFGLEHLGEKFNQVKYWILYTYKEGFTWHGCFQQ